MNPSIWRSVQGLLIDLDGVLYVEDAVTPGAVQAIHFLREKQIAYRFMTNTTVMPLRQLHQKLLRLGFPARPEEIISPPRAAVQYLRRQGNPSCFLAIMEETKQDFAEFRQTDNHPDFIVAGKLGARWDYSLMNKLFHWMIEGAELIALHKDRYTMGENGLQIEFGAFIAGLEYATGKQAVVMGKPAAAFYQTALQDMGVPPERVIMIGDDLVSDVQGAQNIGVRGVLVKTGKYHEELAAASAIQPDDIIDSIANLPDLISG